MTTSPHSFRCPTLQRFILSRCRSKAEAVDLISQLKSGLLPSESRSLETLSVVGLIESSLFARIPALDEASNKDESTAASIVVSLIHEVSSLRRGTTSKSSTDDHFSDERLTSIAPADVELEAAISQSPAFKRMCRSLESVDLQLDHGPRDAIAAGFDGECVLAIRTLISQSRSGDPVAKRHPSLGLLNDLRPSLPAYFNWMIRVDITTGEVPRKFAKYRFAVDSSTEIFHKFLKLEFSSMDWISAPHGLQGYRQRANGWVEPIITDPRDHFCQPDLLDELGVFRNRLFVAIGCSPTVTGDRGFSFQSLCSHFASHLRLARRLSTLEEQYRWLAQASELFLISRS